MTTSMFIPQPHEDSNQIRISPWKNIQKTRKANKDIERRLNNYWDLKGKYQREYDTRLDLLPEEGVADTVGGEIFRAATKLYYDYHNNALVNNTSGAINYLAKIGVLTQQHQPNYYHSNANNQIKRDDIFNILYPYTIGTKIHFGERNVYHAIEVMMDCTLDFLRNDPSLDATHNTFDYHKLKDIDERGYEERCSIRNYWAQEMNAEAVKLVAATAAAEAEANKTKSTVVGNKKKKKKKLSLSPKRSPQDAPPNGEGGTSSGKKKKNNNIANKKTKKKGLSNYNRANDKNNKPGSGGGTSIGNHKAKGKDITSKLSKLTLFD